MEQEEQPRIITQTPQVMARKSRTGAVTALLMLLFLASVAGLAWYVYQENNKTARKLDALQTSISSLESRGGTTTQPEVKTNPNLVTSGFGLFTIVFPDGWGEIQRTTNSDLIVLKGTKQPVTKEGVAPVVKDITGDGLTEKYIFATQFYGNLALPAGATVSDFAFTSGSEKIAAKKYVTKYTTNSNGRTKGDIEYQYRIPHLNGEESGELIVFYNVYASEPVDQVTVVDDIVRSIVFKR